MALLDQVGEELQEERHHQQADVHAIDIGIRGDDDLVVAQSVKPLLDVEGSLKEIELLVLIDHLLRQAIRVEGLAAKGEHRLRIDIATLRDGAARRVSLGDEYTRLLT